MSSSQACFHGGFTTALDPFQIQMRLSGPSGFRWRSEDGDFRLRGVTEDGRTITIWRASPGEHFHFTVQFEGPDGFEATDRYFSLRSQILERLSAELLVDETLQAILDAAKQGESELDLSRRNLAYLPAEIILARDLTLLNLHGNQLLQLPGAIGQLVRLKSLYCGENQLAALPSTLGNLTELIELDACDNHLTELPEDIGNLKKLWFLGLTRNRLTELPSSIGQLRNLKSLWVEENQLRHLPVEIGELTELTQLWLSSNQLTTLPPSMGLLKHLRTPAPPQRKNFIYTPRFMLKLGGNPLVDPPKTMHDTDAVMKYLRGKLEMQSAIRSRITAAVATTGSKQISYESEWLGELPFGVYHWVDCGEERISNDFPSDWTREDLTALVQQGFLRLVSEWQNPEDKFDQRVVYEVSPSDKRLRLS